MMERTVITNFGEGTTLNQVVEFNVCLPTPARTDVAPTSTLIPTIRYTSEFTLDSTTYYLTKVDLALQVSYTDVTNMSRTFTVHSSNAAVIQSSTVPTVEDITSEKIIGMIIPPCVCKVTQNVINSTPTAAMLASNRGYFVYAVSTKGTSAPTP
jgi:hypothetical protein